MNTPSTDTHPVLCHPLTKEPLTLRGDQLVAPTGERFSVREGIPSFVGRTTPRAHRIWAWLYNRVAFGYDLGARLGWRFSFGGAPIQRESYLAKIRIPIGARVLETAVGTASNILALPAGAAYVGIDISFNMLRRAQRNLRKNERDAALIHGDAQFLPLHDDLFDVTFHMGGMQFIARPKVAIDEMLRVTKQGGRVWVIDEAYSVPSVLRRAQVPDLGMLIPPDSADVVSEMINDGELYCLQFTKR